MKNNLSKIIPTFIRRLDEHLLTNHPLWWASKLHYLIYFEILVMIFNLLIANFIPISYTNVPDIMWFLRYSLLLHLIGLIFWLTFQTLFDIKYYNGNRIRMYYLKVYSCFFVVVVFISIAAFFPAWHLNKRIINTLNDTSDKRLPNVPISSNNYLRNAYANTIADSTVVDSVLTNKVDYLYFDSLKNEYNSLSDTDRTNIFVATEGITDFSKLHDFHLVNRADNPWIQYIVFDARFADDRNSRRKKIAANGYITLRIFYNLLLKDDVIYSQKFGDSIYIKNFAAKIIDLGTDTIIKRYCFTTNGLYGNRIILSDSENIQHDLVKEKINEVNETDNSLDNNRNYTRAAEAFKGYFDNFLMFLIMYAFFSELIVIIFVTIRFWGTKEFIFGLIPTALISSMLVGFYYLIGPYYFNSIDAWIYRAIILVFFIYPLLVLKKRTISRLILVQLGMYCAWISTWLFVLTSKSSSMTINWYTPFWAVVIGWAIVSVYLRKVCKLYVCPKP